MTFAQMLLAPIVALMAVDMALTAKALAIGYEEKNVLAATVMKRFGVMRGMLVYEGGLLLILTAMAVSFPSQWALPLSVAIELLLAVLSNLCLITAHSSPTCEA
jgi:hypothetical protein